MPVGPFPDFDACVVHMMKPREEGGGGYDEETARKVCGRMKAELEEGFSWTGEFEILKPTRNLLRGKAIHPVKTFHPHEWPQLRVYLEEELEKSAETLRDKPLYLDHWRPLKGKVLGAHYKDGALEYVAELNDEDILRMIQDGQIKHASVQFEWKVLENVNGIAPRDITFQHLSLLKDMPPGDPMSTVEIWESIARQLKEAKDVLRTKDMSGVSTPPNPQKGSEREDKNLTDKPVLKERVWDRKYINDLPDGAFALILGGGEKDEEGKTIPRNLRKFPHHRADGSIDLPHLRNANARVPQSDLSDEQKSKAQTHLDRHKKAAGIGEFAEESKESFKHGWPILKEQAEEPEEVEEVEFEIAPEPTMDELIESIEGIVEGINEALDALTSRVEALEQAQKPTVQEQQGDGYQAFISQCMAAGKTMEQCAAEWKEQHPETSEESMKDLKETVESLKAQVEVLTEQKNTLQEELEKAKKQAGEAIIPGNVTPPPDMIPKKAIEAVLPPNWIARAWGLGPQRFVQDIKRVLRQSGRHNS